MSLIKCGECGKTVSDKAESCPHCGCPVPKKIICSECGNAVSADDLKCPHCGLPFENDTYIVEKKNKINNKDDDYSVGCNILCFLIPAWAIILFLIFIDNHPKKAKGCGISGLLGFAFYVLIMAIASAQ